MKDFILNGKKCTVKKEILEDERENGGWGLMSLETTCKKSKVSWVLRSLTGAEAWFISENKKKLYEVG